MLAVVQIGSSTVRSPCMTARMVLAAGGADWAVSRPGAATAAVAARPVLRKVRRELMARLVIELSPCTGKGPRSALSCGRRHRPQAINARPEGPRQEHVSRRGPPGPGIPGQVLASGRKQ